MMQLDLVDPPACAVPSTTPAAVWAKLVAEAKSVAAQEPYLASLVDRSIARNATFGDALTTLIGDALDRFSPSPISCTGFVRSLIRDCPDIVDYAVHDLIASHDRNPAWSDYLTPFLYGKGFLALCIHRLANRLWKSGRRPLALHVHGLACRGLSVDIHPAADVGKAVFLDHATGFVMGETAKLGDNVSILHGVTLGGTGKETGDRHPKIQSGVLLGAHAIVLGNITVGAGAKVAAGSVVLTDVPPHTTVAGVPARVVRRLPDLPAPSATMNHVEW